MSGQSNVQKRMHIGAKLQRANKLARGMGEEERGLARISESKFRLPPPPPPKKKRTNA